MSEPQKEDNVKSELQKRIFEVTGDEKYYELIVKKLYESLKDHYKYDEVGKIEDLITMVENKCAGVLHKLNLNTDTLKAATKYIMGNIGKFKVELLSVKMINIKLLGDNKFKKVH